MQADTPPDVEVIKGFIDFTPAQIAEFAKELGIAMTAEDLVFCQTYFRDKERRDPSFAEIRVIDTYWSDHCRHTTFQTAIDKVEFELSPLTKPITKAYADYKKLRESLGRKEKTLCLMDIATIGARELKRLGKLEHLDESEEVNACSIVVEAEIDGKKQEWLVMYKNETHNHPTEIEPFGGAATCLGGAIRDPLSGRSYVYQAMRITGAGDPTQPESTLPGKLPQPACSYCFHRLFVVRQSDWLCLPARFRKFILVYRQANGIGCHWASRNERGSACRPAMSSRLLVEDGRWSWGATGSRRIPANLDVCGAEVRAATRRSNVISKTIQRPNFQRS